MNMPQIEPDHLSFIRHDPRVRHAASIKALTLSDICALESQQYQLLLPVIQALRLAAAEVMQQAKRPLLNAMAIETTIRIAVVPVQAPITLNDVFCNLDDHYIPVPAKIMNEASPLDLIFPAAQVAMSRVVPQSDGTFSQVRAVYPKLLSCLERLINERDMLVTMICVKPVTAGSVTHLALRQ